jgi:DNA mismatch endonuclease (patch repair protein)
VADVISSEERSRVMSLVRAKGNRSTELKLIALFKTLGITGWRRNYPLYGKPDFIFLRSRTAIFVDGCFWHGCRRHYRRPKSKRKYWDKKVKLNKMRDRRVNRILRSRHWTVIRIWEHDVPKMPAHLIRVLENAASLNSVV